MAAPESELEGQRAALRQLNIDDLTAPEPPEPASPARTKTSPPSYLWQGKPWQALQTFALLLSLVVNITLLVLVGVLLIVAGRAFELKNAIAAPLVNGLHAGFVDMDNAHIRITIQVDDEITVDDTLPVVFDLPLQTRTVVTTTESILITGATVNINGGVLVVTDAPATILLPANTPLPVELNLTVPVSQTVPVKLNIPVHLSVPVDIPLNQTDLHQPFTDLRDLIAPYQAMVAGLPDTWGEALCGQSRMLCLFAP